MATTRRYAWHSIGALGAIELTAPGRSACTAAALKRLGFSGKDSRYFNLHAVLAVKHSEDWNREALRPLVEEDRKSTRLNSSHANISHAVFCLQQNFTMPLRTTIG